MRRASRPPTERDGAAGEADRPCDLGQVGAHLIHHPPHPGADRAVEAEEAPAHGATVGEALTSLLEQK